MTASLSKATKKYIGPQIPSLFEYLLKARRGNFPDLFCKLAQEYGEMVHVGLAKRPVFFVFSPEGVEHILQSNQHNYRGFNHSHQKLRPLLGNGLLTSDGELWLKHRRLAQQAFHKTQLEKLSSLMVISIHNFLEQWETRIETQATLDIGREMGLMALGIVSESLFGTKMGERAVRVREAWPLVLTHLIGRMFNPLQLPDQLPTRGNRQYQQSLGLLNEAIYALISEHHAAAQGDENLLGMLIAARDHKLDVQLDDQELRDEVMTIFMAGHETCANALTWTFYLLARHPEIQERLAGEAATVLAGREPAYADLPQLPYAAMVFNESLRMYPPAWVMARDVIQDDEIEGWHIPAGSLIFLSSYVTQRLAKYWDDPLTFNPLRFSPEQPVERPHFAYFPFGGGQRQCLGKNFALIEAQLALPMLVQKYRFSFQETPEDPPYPTYNILRPRNPILLKLERR